MDLSQVNKIYFIGIGGIAMSAVACIAKKSGFEVVGSDSKEIYAPSKDVLDNFGIEYFTGYRINQIEDSKADLYIVSAGEDLNNPELKYVVDKNLQRASFPELLYELSKNNLRIVVTGTHGKSTTAGIVGHLLKNIDDSSFMVGAVLQNYLSNFYLGQGHYFVFEGDEYKSQFDDPTPKFHYYQPDILVLTNLEFDHPDMFADLKAVEDEFRLLIEKMPEDGLIVYNADNVELTRLVHESNVSKVSFAIENEADYKAESISYDSEFTTIEVYNKYSKQISSKLLGQTEQYKIQIPGKINVYNSLASIALLRALGFAQEQISLELLAYKGVKRRFEVVAKQNNIVIVDDYAHHPTAVKESLEAARLKYPQAKIWAVFEPHTFSRTKATLSDLIKSFDSANEVLISEIYPAREKASNQTIKSSEVVEAVKVSNPEKNIRLVRTKQEALNMLKTEVKPGDVVIIMAVGDFNKLAYELKEILK